MFSEQGQVVGYSLTRIRIQLTRRAASLLLPPRDISPHRLKAFTSVAVLGISVLMGLETPSQRTLVIVVLISSGVALASYNEIDL